VRATTEVAELRRVVTVAIPALAIPPPTQWVTTVLEMPRVETTPVVEMPRVETMRVETPQLETMRVETPRLETMRLETMRLETPKKAPKKAQKRRRKADHPDQSAQHTTVPSWPVPCRI